MSTPKIAVLGLVPLLWASVVVAQPAPTDQTPAPSQGQEMNRAEWARRMCTEHYAHKSASLAYLEAKLDLTEQQRAAWNKWRQSVLDGAAKERSTCLETLPKDNARPTAVEREARMEKILAVKLQSLQASRPALQGLYDALTPSQRTVMDQPRGHEHGMFEHGGMMSHRRMGGEY